MDVNFWTERWRSNRIAFHQGRANPQLAAYLGALGLEPGAQVFVPLCGKAVDLRRLADRGYRLLGIGCGSVEDAMPAP